jgi:hypothetical protein
MIIPCSDLRQTSNNIIQKGLAFARELSGSVTVPGARRLGILPCSLIASAKLNDVEPFTYLRDVLQRMTEGHPMSRLDELLPWNWPKIPVKH